MKLKAWFSRTWDWLLGRPKPKTEAEKWSERFERAFIAEGKRLEEEQELINNMKPIIVITEEIATKCKWVRKMQDRWQSTDDDRIP